MKTTLYDLGAAPITIEKIGDLIIIEQYVKQMRLGPTTAKWLADRLNDCIINGQFGPFSLEREGQKLLTFLRDTKYLFLIGTNVRFNMDLPTAEHMLHWLRFN